MNGTGLLPDLVGGALLLSLCLASGNAPSSTRPGRRPIFLIEMASDLARSMDDPHPQSVTYVRSTRARANEVISGAYVNSDQAVFVLMLEGRFRYTNSYVPRGNLAPTGRYVTAVIDASDHTIVDLGIGNERPDLSALGSVHPLDSAPD